MRNATVVKRLTDIWYESTPWLCIRLYIFASMHAVSRSFTVVGVPGSMGKHLLTVGVVADSYQYIVIMISSSSYMMTWVLKTETYPYGFAKERRSHFIS